MKIYKNLYERYKYKAKVKYIIMILFASALLLLIPNISNAAIDVTRNIYANNGSAKYEFTGLELNKSHEYEIGLTKTAAANVENWHLITEYTETTATIRMRGCKYTSSILKFRRY